MTFVGSRSSPTYSPLTCRSCGKSVSQSLFCSWPCAVRALSGWLLLAFAVWAALAALLISLF